MFFDRPQSFALLLPVPFVLIFMFVRLRTLRPVIQKLTLRIKLRALLWSFAWLSALIALAGPSWGTQHIPVQRSGSAVCFVFDISYSMTANDGGSGVQRQRLEQSKDFARSLLERLNGSAVSAVLAKGAGVLALPLTEDYSALESLIDTLSPAMLSASGSNVASGIDKAVESFPPQSARNSFIVVCTDGDETAGNLNRAVSQAASYGIHIILVGFGSEKGTQIISGDGKTPVKTALRRAKLEKAAQSGDMAYYIDFSAEQNGSGGTNRGAGSGFNSGSNGSSGVGTGVVVGGIFSGAGSAVDLAADIIEKGSRFAGSEQTAVVGGNYEIQTVKRHTPFLFVSLLCFIAGFMCTHWYGIKRTTVVKSKNAADKSGGEGSTENPDGSFVKSKGSVLLCFLLSVLFLPFGVTSCSAWQKENGAVLTGLYRWKRHDYQNAAASFLDAAERSREIKNDELLQYALFGLSSSYLMQDENDAALAKLDDMPPSLPPSLAFAAYYNRGIIAFRSGDFDTAAECFKNALLINSGSLDAKINLELCLQQRGLQVRQGKQELIPAEAQNAPSAAQEAVFSLIRENDKQRWKNTYIPSTQDGSSADY
ncbi:MAG: vWA domain-containing protein [Treponema lecithinolyticum]|uniref:vWA domain-containing protein n=1 Tax=Treponema lecithinolyticum TaxID=53418 RepID=UPI003FA21BA3